jgi:hypothetical protein
MRAEIWTLTRATFTGAAILLREKAAYRNTSFELAASRCRSTPLHAVHAGATGHFRNGAGVAFGKKDGRKEQTWNHRQAKAW